MNNNSFEHISHNRALEILRGTTTLSITVKSNLLAFKENILASNDSLGQKAGSTGRRDLARLKHYSVSDLDDIAVPPVIAVPPRDKGGGGKEKGISVGKRNKISKALKKFSFMPTKTAANR